MNDYRNLLTKTYQMKSPAAICIEKATDEIMNWYVSRYKGGLDFEASFTFDRNEPFEPIFKAQWNEELERARRTGNHNSWCHIVSVGSACQQKTPGIQIADMLAWGVNRVHSKSVQPGDKGAFVVAAMNNFLNSISQLVAEPYFRKNFRPLVWI